MKLTIKLFITAMLFTVASTSYSAVVTYTDRTTWAGAGTVSYTEDFEGYTSDVSFRTSAVDVGPFSLSTIGTAVSTRNLIDVRPVVVSTASIATFGNSLVEIFVNDAAALTAEITFDTAVKGFFADFWAAGNTTPLTLTLSLLSGGTTAVNVPGIGNGEESFGFWSTEAITSIIFSNVQNDGFNIDNISGGQTSTTPAVPVPAAVFMLTPALLGFLGLRRKAKNSVA